MLRQTQGAFATRFGDPFRDPGDSPLFYPSRRHKPMARLTILRVPLILPTAFLGRRRRPGLRPGGRTT